MSNDKKIDMKIMLNTHEAIEHMLFLVDNTSPEDFEQWAKNNPEDYDILCDTLVDHMRTVVAVRHTVH